LVEKEINGPSVNNQEPEPPSLGDEILRLLNQRTANPGEAFVLLQQLCIFVWDQYQIDWKDKEDLKVADNRKQRYMDYVSDLIDTLIANNVLSEKSEDNV
jgi:hypothetical protein